MALFTENSLREKLNSRASARYTNKANIVAELITESRRERDHSTKLYDIFLSHSSSDAELVFGLKLILEDMGKSVYVDWIEDPLLDRKNVTAATASKLRNRMKQCSSLIYAFSKNAAASKWMPWELGYFDGLKGSVAVLPITQVQESSFVGSEYLGIYPYIDITGQTLFAHRTPDTYINFNSFLGGARI